MTYHRFLKIILWIACILALAGCDLNSGFPRKVAFTAAGGETHISGKGYVFSIIIEDETGRCHPDSIYEFEDCLGWYIRCKWLSVISKADAQGGLTLIAEPNETYKARTMLLDIGTDAGIGTGDIKVTQAAKRD